MQKQVIEHAGLPVGIVIPDGDKLKFIAVKYHVIDLDGQRFQSAGDVRHAIREHLTRQPSPLDA
ncbi:MAG: hypothetical protein RIR97_1045, partial [Pseudomonadota bacterium]|jgi:hypothetical protein